MRNFIILFLGSIILALLSLNTFSSETSRLIKKCHTKLSDLGKEHSHFYKGDFRRHRKYVYKSFCSKSKFVKSSLDSKLKHPIALNLSVICDKTASEMSDENYIRLSMNRASEDDIRNWFSCIKEVAKRNLKNVEMIVAQKPDENSIHISLQWKSDKKTNEPRFSKLTTISLDCNDQKNLTNIIPNIVDLTPLVVKCTWTNSQTKTDLVVLHMRYKKRGRLLFVFPFTRNINTVIAFPVKRESPKSRGEVALVLSKEASYVTRYCSRVKYVTLTSANCNSKLSKDCPCEGLTPCYYASSTVLPKYQKSRYRDWKLKRVYLKIIDKPERYKFNIRENDRVGRIVGADIFSNSNEVSYKLCAAGTMVKKGKPNEPISLFVGKIIKFRVPHGKTGILRGVVYGKLYSKLIGKKHRYLKYLHSKPAEDGSKDYFYKLTTGKGVY